MSTFSLSGAEYYQLICSGAAMLRANANEVNDLNVFPIPDGDTGENMCMTMQGGVNAGEMQGKSLGEAADSIATGMLLSARGNSGVILSQFFAGIGKGFAGIETATALQTAEAFQAGVKRAYDSVIKPTEGTILTVAREGVEVASAAIKEDSSLEEFFSAMLTEMRASLQRTPDLLPVLKEAGVIDSGGAGLIYVIEGMLKKLRGEQIAESSVAAPAVKAVDLSGFTEDSVMEFGYCTEFLLQLQNSKINISEFTLNPILTFLQSIGDSIVAFQTGSIVKVHVHTLTPGVVLNEMQKYGEFLTLKVENMTLQHNESVFAEPEAKKTEKKHVPFATIAVAEGQGIKETFLSLGADFVIDGGQGKNPSSEDFLQAFEEVNADCIFVLPNNSNIVMAAQLAGNMCKNAKVHVIPTKSVGDGYAVLSMLSYDSGNEEEIKADMMMAMEGVITGQVTKSVRDAVIDSVDIKSGDYIGFAGKQMLSSCPDKLEAAFRMLEKLDAADHEIMIVIYGKDAEPQEKEGFRKHISSVYKRMELYEIEGGQAVYDFEIILE